jgi:ATP-dependent protease ClpP protease subunit
MMIGHIYINGLIGNFKDEVGVELIDIVSQVQKQRSAEEFIVHINSKGGDIDKGYDIYNYLKNLPQQITTEINGMCASMATVIALAGDKRVMVEGSQFMIHNPWAADVKGDADELLLIHEAMRGEEDKMIAFYSDHTGILKEGLDALMKAETFLTAEKALELGFITEIKPASLVKAMAFKTEKVKKENTMEKVGKDILDQLSKMAKFLGVKDDDKPAIKAMVVSDSNGASLSITKADGSELEGVPAKGDLVTVDGQAGEGSYVLPDMKITLSVKAGVIDSVEEEKVVDPAAPNPDLEQAKAALEAAQARVAELEASNKTLETKAQDFDTFKEEVTTKMALMDKVLKASHSNYVPLGKVTSFKKEEDAPVLVTKEALQKIKAERNTKNK